MPFKLFLASISVNMLATYRYYVLFFFISCHFPIKGLEAARTNDRGDSHRHRCGHRYDQFEAEKHIHITGP